MTNCALFVPGFFLVAFTSGARAQCPTFEPGFGSSAAELDGAVHALAVFDDGGGPALYAGGRFERAGAQDAKLVARWDGSAWSALGTGLAASAFPGLREVSALAVFDDGGGPALYAAGFFDSAGGVPVANIARWDGAAWSDVGGGTDHTIESLAVFDDGTGTALYAAGNFGLAGGAPASRVARWDGSTWSQVGQGFAYGSETYALRAWDDGGGMKLYAAGALTAVGGSGSTNLVRWDGATWSSAGSANPNAYAHSLAIHDDGSGAKLYLGGAFTSVGGVAASRVARWDGAAWSAVGAGLPFRVHALATFDDGSGARLYAAGYPPPNSHDSFAVWDGAAWTTLPSLGGLDANEGDNVQGVAMLVDDAGDGARLLVGGDFTTAGSSAARRLGRWDGAAWSPLGPLAASVDLDVVALHRYDGGAGEALYAGGAFRSAGDVEAAAVARFDGVAFEPLGPGFDGPLALVRALATWNDGGTRVLCAGGRFSASDGTTMRNVARWDGAAWSPFGAGLPYGEVYTLLGHDDGAGEELYAGGAFADIPPNFFGPDRVARWLGTSWQQVGSGANAPVRALASFAGDVIAGGDFTSPAARIARWTGTTWLALGDGVDGVVRALAVLDDGDGPILCAGGDFQHAGGVASAHVARWDGLAWSAVPGFPRPVHGLTVVEEAGGPKLWAIGRDPLTTGAPSTTYVGRWDGAAWAILTDPEASAGAYAIGALESVPGRDDVYIGLGRNNASTDRPNVPFLRRVQSCGTPVVAYCFGDGTSAPCPCSNSGAAGHGCETSGLTGGALLAASGTLHPDAFALHASGLGASALTILLQGDQELAPLAFGDGLRCAGGSLKRLYAANASAGALSFPPPGEPSISARSTALGDPLFPGAVRYYLAYFRDPEPNFCPAPAGGTFNASQGQRVTW